MAILHGGNQSLCGQQSSCACQHYSCSQTKSMQMFLLHGKITNLDVYCISVSLCFIAFCVCFAVVVFSCLSWPQKLGIWRDCWPPSSYWWTSLLNAPLSAPVKLDLVRPLPARNGTMSRMLLESICFIHLRRQQPYQSNNSECPQKSNVISTMAVQYLSMHNSRTHCGCNMKKKHLLLLYWRFPSGLIVPYIFDPILMVSWRCCILTAVHFLGRT